MERIFISAADMESRYTTKRFVNVDVSRLPPGTEVEAVFSDGRVKVGFVTWKDTSTGGCKLDDESGRMEIDDESTTGVYFPLNEEDRIMIERFQWKL